MARALVRVVVPIALVFTLSGCALAVRRPSVAELKYNPGRYQDRTVSVEGVTVFSTAPLSLLVLCSLMRPFLP